MPTSSGAAAVDKTKNLKVKNVCEARHYTDKHLLKIAPALPSSNDHKRSLYVRSHSTLNVSNISKAQNESVSLQNGPDGLLRVLRTQEEKEKHPDRISLDRRGLTHVPLIETELRLRLLSLQHNLINDLESLSKQKFPALVFLDLYDNQLEQIKSLDVLENVRVLLLGKNRIKKLEGLDQLKRLEVLDLHGNQIVQIAGLSALQELKVLNLAGNQIRAVGGKDLQGLQSLQEVNLRRNRLRKLQGLTNLNCLHKLFLSNNDLQSIEDISSIAKCPSVKEICIDSNPVFLSGDCVSFLVSYLPNLVKLNAMQITEQVKKAAMAWRRNKENTNAAFMDLTSETTLNCRREDVICNARTNWELLRSQTKCLTGNAVVDKSTKNLKPDSDFVLTSFKTQKSKSFVKVSSKAPLLPDKKLIRTTSQDTENTTSSSATSSDLLKLPPILVPIISKLTSSSELKRSGSLSSLGPNIDSASSATTTRSSSSSSSSESEPSRTDNVKAPPSQDSSLPNSTPEDSSSNLSVTTLPSSEVSSKRSIKSAASVRAPPPRAFLNRAATAKPKKTVGSPNDREQGGDYLIEICGRHLNVYGQGALRFIDKPWSPGKANDVTTVKFNYVNFNSVVGFLCKVKHRFINAEHFVFKETNIMHLGQLNALSEVQGLVSLTVEHEGNPIGCKQWRNYAIYRLAHWGLRFINDIEVTADDVKAANGEYQSLSDLVLWSLPEDLLHPLLARLRIDTGHGSIGNAKKWLSKADPELKSVVCKEALQWKKSSAGQEELAMRQKARQHISGLLDEMTNAMQKLRILDHEWGQLMHDFVQNTLLDYSQLDRYMKQKMQELNRQ